MDPQEQEEFEFRARAEQEAAKQQSGNPVGNFVGGVAHGIVQPFADLAQTTPLATVSRGLGSVAGGGKFDTTPQSVNIPGYGQANPPKNVNEYGGDIVKAGSMMMGPEAGMGPALGIYNAGQALSENKPTQDIINRALVGDVEGQGLQVAIPAVGGALSAVGKAIPQGLKNAGASLLDSATGRISRYTKFGADPARGLLEQNIASGSSPEEILFKVQNRLEELDQAKQAHLNDPANATKYVDASSLYKPIDDALSDIGPATDTNSALINKLGNARNDIDRMVGEKDLTHLSLADADALKQRVGNLSKFSGNAAEKDYQTFDKVSNSLYGNLNSQIREASPELGDIYDQQHDLVSASKALTNEDMLAGKSGKVAGLAKRGGFWTGLGAAGALAHGNVPVAAGLAGTAAVEEAIPAITSYPGVRSRLAQGLYNTGQGIEDAGQSVKDLLDRAMGKSKPAVQPPTQKEPGKELATIPQPDSGTLEYQPQIGQNKRSVLSNYLPPGQGSGPTINMGDRGRFGGDQINLGDTPDYTRTGNLPATGQEGLQPRRPSQINMPEHTESDIQALADKFGVRNRNVRSSVNAADIEPVVKSSTTEGKIMSPKLRDLVYRTLNRRKANFGDPEGLLGTTRD